MTGFPGQIVCFCRKKMIIGFFPMTFFALNQLFPTPTGLFHCEMCPFDMAVLHHIRGFFPF